MQDNDLLMTPREVATWLRVGLDTIRKYRNECGLPYIQIGRGRGKVRFKQSAVAEWLRKREMAERTP